MIEIFLSAYPQNLRESDDQAIDWLLRNLDAGGSPGIKWPLTQEPWSVIVARRIANKYKPQRTARVMWIRRHYHVRQLACANESAEQSASHVARVWSGNAKTIEKHSQGNKDQALLWIDTCLKQNRDNPANTKVGWPNVSDAEYYAALDRAIERDIVPAYPKDTPPVK